VRTLTVMTGKELTQVSNRLRFRVQLWTLVGVLAAAWLLMAAEMMYFSRGPVLPEDLAEFGRWFFVVGLAILSIMVPLAVLVAGAGIVISERVNRRLDLLLVTSLASASIIAAKAVSIFARAFLGILLGLPIFALLVVFGGVDRTMIFQGLMFLLANIWLYGSVGLFASVLAKKTSTALAWAGFLALVWNLLPLLYLLGLFVLLPSRAAEKVVSSAACEKVWALSPFYTFVTAFIVPMGGALHVHAAESAAAGLAFFGGAMLLFRRTAGRSRAADAAREGPLARGRRAGRAGAHTARARIGRLFGGGVISKELASWRPRRALLSLAWFAILYGVGALMSIATGHWPDLTSLQDHMVVLGLEEGGLMFLLAAQASTRVVREKEGRTLQALLLTDMSGGRILLGKAAAILIEQAPGMLFIMGHISFVLVLGLLQVGTAWLLMTLFFFGAVFSVTLGLYYSLAAKRTAEAVVLTVWMWLLGPFTAAVILAIISAMIGLESWNDRTPLVMVFIPLMTLAGGLALYRSRRGGFGAALPAAVHMLLLQMMFVLNLVMPENMNMWRYGSDDFLASSFLLTPGALALLPVERGQAGLFLAAWAMRAVVPLWMALLALLGFEAQARRER